MTTDRPVAPPSFDPRLRRGLQELFGLDAREFSADADLESDLHLDSLSAAELRVWLEDAVGVRLAVPEHGPSPRTLGALQAWLDAALGRDTTAPATAPGAVR